MSSPMSCRNAALPLPELPPSPSPEIHIEKPDSRPWSKSLDVSPMDPDSCPTALGPRKRRASSPNPGPPKAVHNFRSWKRSRLSVVLPPSFWDSLSEIPLTRNALRELDRRNFKAYRDFKRDHAHNPQRQQTKGGLPSNQSPAYLKQIRAFARHGGPDLRDMRGYPNPAEPSFCMSSSYTTLRRLKRGASQPTKSSQRIRDPKLTTQETKNTGPYDRAFQQHLIDNSILPFPYEYPDGHWPSEPENLGEIRQYLTRRRDSLSPSRFSEHDFRKFVIQDARAVKERLVAAHVFPMVRGDTEHPVYFSGDVPFNNLKPLTSVPLVAAQPDLYYGSRPEQLDLRVRRALGAHIIPSTQADLPLAPNFFVELKGPKGDLCVGDLQLSYDMAFGARGLQSLRAYGGGSPTDFKDAYTLGCFYISGTLTMFACHQIPPSTPGGSPGYAMTKNSPELSLASQASVRETLATSQDTTQPTGANKHPTDELDTSADELSLPSPRPAKRRKSRAVRNQSLKREQKRDNRGNLS
ncbi:hypothetical protein XA68_11490 [Ophiocordyceps unilateralis]|uniref:Uncharacterized protein n=1 Tax=Ophiocordyceps unilateralis TaxID=268505 RepID=A0A2A9PGN6_OPHUN|nr:hypothetical protein XA68_11490 [Ophiocordyceps unilateralis]